MDKASQSIETLVEAFRRQSSACTTLGSPWTAALLACLAADLEDRGPSAELLADWTLPPVPSAVALRMTGALNALVLDGHAPELAALHPTAGSGPVAQGAGGSGADAVAGATAGTTADAEVDAEVHAAPIADPRRSALFAAARRTLAAQGARVAEFISHAVQTNEVQRSAVLAPGLLHVAARTGASLRIREIGASGGLNLLWDRYRYRLGAAHWGDPDAAVRLTPQWEGPVPELPAAVEVTERRGVDIHPLDFRDDAVVRRGLAYIWPDQAQRVANFQAAVRVLRATDQQVEAGDAADWLPTVLTPLDGIATVVCHSIMWQYMPPATRDRVEAAIRDAGAAATPHAPLAWLRYEPLRGGPDFELTLDLFSGPQRPPRERLAWVHPHGASVRWLAGDDSRRRLEDGSPAPS